MNNETTSADLDHSNRNQAPAAPARAFGPRPYRGGCVCGAVRYEAVIDFSAGTSRCNCSICAKASLWSVMVRPENFTLLAGAEHLIDFQRGGKFSHYPFCKTCGIRSFGHGDAPWMGGAYYAVHVNCLDLEEGHLTGVLIRHFDGRQDKWDSPRFERLEGPT
jgi:hypothetical protein